MQKASKSDIFFDLDHTLWDFETNSRAALKEIFENRKLDNYIENFGVFLAKYEEINAKLWELYAQQKITKAELRIQRFAKTLSYFNLHSEELSNHLAKDYVTTSPYQTHLFPKTKDVLTALKNADYKLHIITNGFLEVQHIKLENSGIKEYFDVILCSEEVGANKPAPETFLTALQMAKTNPQDSLMIGDDLISDIQGAKNVGMQGVLFDPNEKYEEEGVVKIKSLEEVMRLV